MKKHQNKVQELVIEMGISEQEFCKFTGITVEGLAACPDCTENSQIEGVYMIFQRLQAWFDTSDTAWLWYVFQPILGFGHYTGAELVMQNGTSGISMLLNYIDSKELGGFE